MKTRFEKAPKQRKSRSVSRHQLDRPATGAGAGALQRLVDNSATMRRQREQLEASFGQPAQRVAEEEELMQGKFDTLQCQGPDEEELLQGKFDTLQRQPEEEEELLQGKFDTLQRQEPEEDELMIPKFAQPVQRETSPNKTGIPDNIKSGIESLSGVDMSGVRVHYNSSKPARINALAYAQGNDIHLGAGQEKHLPHEAWHTVQQRQGRVQPTMQLGGEKINDDAGLEREADVMGEKARQFKKIIETG